MTKPVRQYSEYEESLRRAELEALEDQHVEARAREALRREKEDADEWWKGPVR